MELVKLQRLMIAREEYMIDTYQLIRSFSYKIFRKSYFPKKIFHASLCKKANIDILAEQLKKKVFVLIV